MHERFPITDSGPLSFWLNMHFSRDRNKKTITIHQEPKIAKVLADERFTPADRLIISKPCLIPASSDIMLSKLMSPIDKVEQTRMEKYPY